MITKDSAFKTISKTMLSVSVCTLLAACQTTGSTGQNQSQASSASERGYKSNVDNALQNAANKASRSGKSNRSLAYLERIYTRNSEDEKAALRYAEGLRQNGFLTRASVVMEPFANDPDGSIDSKIEYGASQLALGNYATAERYMQQVVNQNNEHFRAYNYLGVAQDAQEKHSEAQANFERGLNLWEGDPSAIMNNLALNLTAQGKLEEAIDVLQDAKALAPHKREIERNLRIATALYQSSTDYYTPRPASKPIAKPQEVETQSGDVKVNAEVDVEEEPYPENKMKPAVEPEPKSEKVEEVEDVVEELKEKIEESVEKAPASTVHRKGIDADFVAPEKSSPPPEKPAAIPTND